MKRWLVLIYGVTCYVMFLGVFLYSIPFIGNFWISNPLDGAPTMDLWTALAIDFGLLTFFAVQHSGMARTGFKNWLTKYIPEPAERSTYVLMSNIALILFFVFWQPLGGTIWKATSSSAVSAIYFVYFAGWALLFVATCAISHLDLFGLRQVWLYFKGRPYVPYEFRVPFLYSIVRHPLYVGWLMIFWAAPTMTFSHLVFAATTTAYILVAIQLEERDLTKAFGNKYVKYQRDVPMLIPRLSASTGSESGVFPGPMKTKA